VLKNIESRIELNLLKTTNIFNKVHDVQKFQKIDTLSIGECGEQASLYYVYTIAMKYSNVYKTSLHNNNKIRFIVVVSEYLTLHLYLLLLYYLCAYCCFL